MATPQVAGIAGLVWASSLCTTNTCVRNRIESTADPIAGTGTYWTYGRVNARNAVTTTPPSVGTGFRSPTQNAAQSGGDGNGFQTNPTNAYANDGVFAVDTNSGTGTSTSCTNGGKDRHRFSGYGVSLPANAIVTGIRRAGGQHQRMAPDVCPALVERRGVMDDGQSDERVPQHQ
jgi:hypothetical protein